MPFELALKYIEHRFEKTEDDMIYQRWIANPFIQNMSFEEFKNKLRPKKARSDEEILEEVYAKFRKAGIG